MSITQQTLTVGQTVGAVPRARRGWRGGVQGADFYWAVAFALPYAAVFFAFVVYPILYGFWLGSNPELYLELWDDPTYTTTVVNTLIYVVLGVNLKMIIAFLLSGFFYRKSWWTKILLVIFILPWAMPALPAFLSIHWLLMGEWGFLNALLFQLFSIEGPHYLTERWSGVISNICSYNWKNTPFWTVIFLAGRMAIPTDLYEAAQVDGANRYRMFRDITMPLMAQLYLVSTLLATVFALGDFNSVFFVTGGGPAMSTEVMATLGIRYAFVLGDPPLGVAAVLTTLPLLLPLVLLLMHLLRKQEMQL